LLKSFGFVHRSRTVFCRAVPNPNITIRDFFIAAQRREGAPPICVSLLPLFHISGVARCLTHLLLGHSTLLLGGCDPPLFWEVLNQHTVAYYAATTAMHQALVDSARSMGIPPGIVRPPQRPTAMRKSRIVIVGFGTARQKMFLER
jgi:acyl-CoA synthetase (AMP-forming)/AMP-acid ligase II